MGEGERSRSCCPGSKGRVTSCAASQVLQTTDFYTDSDGKSRRCFKQKVKLCDLHLNSLIWAALLKPNWRDKTGSRESNLPISLNLWMLHPRRLKLCTHSQTTAFIITEGAEDSSTPPSREEIHQRLHRAPLLWVQSDSDPASWF